MSFWVLFFRMVEFRLSLSLDNWRFYKLDNLFILFGKFVIVLWFKLRDINDVSLLILLGICFKLLLFNMSFLSWY